jgi:hypothetical protein
MIPFKPPFYVTGAAGKPIDLTPVSLESLRASGVKVSYRSFAADTFRFVQQEPNSGVWTVPQNKQRISLFDADGRRMFVGTAELTKSFEGGIASVEVVCTNDYNFLKKTPVRTTLGGNSRSAPRFPPFSRWR